jgi:hypothetical protein
MRSNLEHPEVPDMVKQKRTNRPYQSSREDLVNLAIDDPLRFELVLTKLAEQYAVDGPDEEDCVEQMAKGLFLKRKLPTKRTRMEGYSECEVVDQFNDLLLAEAGEEEVKLAIKNLGGSSGQHLRKEVPRENFDSAEEWFQALKDEIFSVVMPRAIALRYNDEQQFEKPSEKLTENVLIRDLTYEKLVNEQYDRALCRLLKIKAAKRQITFRERRRFDCARPDRLRGVIVD